MERERLIRVPKDQKAMEDYYYGIQKKEQMEEMVLSEEQHKILYDTGVFDLINDRCNIIIDSYEEEWLEFDKIPIAIEIVNQLIKSNPNEQLVKFKRMLDMAIAYKTIVGFDF